MRFARKFAIILAAFAIILSFTACEFFFDEEGNLVFRLYQVSGKVINVRESNEFKTGSYPTSGTVKIYKFGSESSPIKTASVQYDGSFSLGDIPAGDYMLKYVDEGGFYGIPVAIKIYGSSNVSGLAALVFSTGEIEVEKSYTNTTIRSNSIEPGDVLIVSTWENRDYDIDSHAHIGTPKTNIDGDGNYISVNGDIFYNNRYLDNVTQNNIILERDIVASNLTGSNPSYPVETMLVKKLAIDTEMRYYVNAFTGSITGVDEGTIKQPAGVVTYVMEFLGTSTRHLGTFYPPLNTDSQAIGMVRLVGEDGYIDVGPFGVGAWGSIMRGLENNRAYYGEAVDVMN